MCLGIPGRVVEIDRDGNVVIVERLGVQSKVHTQLMDEEIRIGDYVMVHAGYAIGRMETEDALETIDLLEEISKGMDGGNTTEPSEESMGYPEGKSGLLIR